MEKENYGDKIKIFRMVSYWTLVLFLSIVSFYNKL